MVKVNKLHIRKIAIAVSIETLLECHIQSPLNSLFPLEVRKGVALSIVSISGKSGLYRNIDCNRMGCRL